MNEQCKIKLKRGRRSGQAKSSQVQASPAKSNTFFRKKRLFIFCPTPFPPWPPVQRIRVYPCPSVVGNPDPFVHFQRISKAFKAIQSIFERKKILFYEPNPIFPLPHLPAFFGFFYTNFPAMVSIN